MDSMPPDIHMISLNCWGLKFISKYHKERLREIGRTIANASPSPNIVGLQECWTREDYRAIRQETRGILPYGKFYHSGIFGGGLAILSKWPIEESSMVRYPLNGRPNAFYHGDWFVGKGVACARIRIGPEKNDCVQVFTTHLHAPYEPEPNDSYICHRTAQAWEIAKLIKGAVDRGNLVVVLGDFNMIPLSLAHRIITTHGCVKDVWRVLHPESSVGSSMDLVEQARRRPIPTAKHNISENGTTCDTVLNTWRWSKAEQKRLGPNKPPVDIPLDTVDPKAKRLDYIFTNTGFREGCHGGWVIRSAKVGMIERHPTLQCSLSDHLSVETTLEWTPAPLHNDARKREQDQKREDSSFAHGTFLQSPRTSALQTSSSNPNNVQLLPVHEEPYLPIPIYDEILIMIAKYMTRERKQRRYRLYHFVTSIALSVGCHIAVWWSPRAFVSFLLVLLSTVNLSAGLINGLIGGLFVGSEIRALKEFQWEIKNVRAMAGGDTGGRDTFEEAAPKW